MLQPDFWLAPADLIISLPYYALLHWLPVCYRIEFKIVLFVFKVLSGMVPEYLSDILNPNTSSRPPRSSEKRVSMVPRSRLKLRGDRGFSIAGPTLWNSLPVSLRLVSSESEFKSKLKTYLFQGLITVIKVSLVYCSQNWSYLCLFIYIYVFLARFVQHSGQLLLFLLCFINTCWLILID